MILGFKKLIMVLMIFAFGASYGATLTYDEVCKSLNNRIYLETQQKLSGISNDFKINITGIPKENYSVNEQTQPKIEIISQNTNFMPNSYRRVLIKDSKNNVIRAFPINIQTLVYKNVLTAAETIPYNQEIKAASVNIERKEISKYLGKTYSDYSSGMITTRNYSKGSIILTDYVKSKSAIMKNSIVDIVFQSDKGLRITLRGKALKEGSIGDTIPVRSDKYNKIYSAQVNSSNEVIVRI